MTKVAKLVTFHPMVRVIVDKNATDEEIFQAAHKKAIRVLENDGALDNADEIKDDTDCPFGAFSSDIYYQPYHPTIPFPKDLNSWEVFASKEKAQKLFPDFEIREYSGDDIEDHKFVDDEFCLV